MMRTGTDCKGLFKAYESNVPGVYGGLICNKPFSKEKIRLVEDVLRLMRIGRVDLFGNPFCDFTCIPPVGRKRGIHARY